MRPQFNAENNHQDAFRRRFNAVRLPDNPNNMPIFRDLRVNVAPIRPNLNLDPRIPPPPHRMQPHQNFVPIRPNFPNRPNDAPIQGLNQGVQILPAPNLLPPRRPEEIIARRENIERAMNSIRELFPDLDLDDFIAHQTQLRLDCRRQDCTCGNEHVIVNALSDHILDRVHEFRQRARPLPPTPQRTPNPRRTRNPNDNSMLNMTVYEPAAENPFDSTKGELIEKLFNRIITAFNRAIADDTNKLTGHAFSKCDCYLWLQKTFEWIRCDNLQKIYGFYRSTKVGHSPLGLAIVCFCMENEIIERNDLQPIRALVDEAVPWRQLSSKLAETSIASRRKKFRIFQPSNEILGQVQQFHEFIGQLKEECADLFERNGRINMEALRNSEGAGNVDNIEIFECIVCFEQFPLQYGVTCQRMNANENIPNTSKAADALHVFCRPCLREHARAATGEMPLAEGGVGLRCMEDGCPNPIPLYDVKHYLPREVRRRLNERIIEENLGMAQLENLERCRKCNFAVDMDVPKEVNKVFQCMNPNCGYQFCRICEEPWNRHMGMRCDEVATYEKKAKQLAEKMNDTVVRQCPRCKVMFVKSEACNKMRCRCGLTMCYICKATQIDYDHFCRCAQDPKFPRTIGEKCKNCRKECLLWEDPNKRDALKINEVLKDAPKELRDNLLRQIN